MANTTNNFRAATMVVALLAATGFSVAAQRGSAAGGGPTVNAAQAPAAAQRGGDSGPPAGTVRTMPPVPPGKKFVALGCVSREEPAAARGGAATPAFVITDMRGGKPTVYKLDGDQTELTFHTGHRVEVAGTLSTPTAGATGPHADALVMKIASLTYLSKTCTP